MNQIKNSKRIFLLGTLFFWSMACESAPVITRVNVSSEGVQANRWGGEGSYWPSISGDGRFVAFHTDAPNLVTGDSNGAEDVFVHDRQTGTTERVSVKTDGSQGYFPSRYSSISRDGRYVAFWSFALLVPGDDYVTKDIYVHDRKMKITKRVPFPPRGGGRYFSIPSISDDGQSVAFASDTPLVSGDTNKKTDVFVHNFKTGFTTRVSVDSSGKEASAGGSLLRSSSSISGDGRYVVFSSFDVGLVPDDTNLVNDIFVRDLQAGLTERVSVDSNGTEANAAAGSDATISADGRYVAFSSKASNLVVGDTNGGEDVFVRDRQTGTTTRIRTAPENSLAHASYVDRISISDDGRYVAFDSWTDDLVPNDTNQSPDVFIHDRQTGITTRESLDNDGLEIRNGIDPVLSGDGRFVSFRSSDVYVISPDANASSSDIFVRGPLTTGQTDLVIDFGSIGLWARMNDTSWQKLSNSSPDKMVVGDVDGNGQDDVIADFTSTLGGIFVKRNGGGWAKLHNLSPDSLAVGDLDNNGKDDIVIDFGGIGLWVRMNDASWQKLNNSSPDQVVVGDVDGNGQDDVIADFSSTLGGIFIKRNQGGWSKLHNFSPDALAVGDLDGNGKDDIVIDFGGIGLWARMNDSSWIKLHNNSPDLIATGDVDGNGAADVLATFGSSFGGLWQKLNLVGWSQLNANAPDAVVTGDVDGSGKDDIVGDFGSTLGGIFVRRNQGAWSKLHNFNPDSITAGRLDKN